MNLNDLALLRFQDAYLPKVWGGHKLRTVLHKLSPENEAIGEDWLVSDHPQHESLVLNGPAAGKTLRQLMLESPELVLGRRAQPTPNGRFPLLLKIIDAALPLSVQVHPDDAWAARLHEPDVGKTEMWHVLQADASSELICGLEPQVDAPELRAGVLQGTVEELMVRIPATAGTTVFVPAGTVHAIGAGILLAEIQQNSDITYRLYDYGRPGDDGKPRALHLDKGLQVVRYGQPHAGPNTPLGCRTNGAECVVLGACHYFAGRLLHVPGALRQETHGDSFHILLAKTGAWEIHAARQRETLGPGDALLVAGANEHFVAEGTGELLDYFVPDLERDIMGPLQAAGHSQEQIQQLTGMSG
ncbi:MAG: class I mannose-6-phosphate isomerase [Candidatus Hydrogenedentes bacterium]|nr:class I mannose-6-phosphate isomerase [Candidatus Hydrogenedentota bacterium]